MCSFDIRTPPPSPRVTWASGRMEFTPPPTNDTDDKIKWALGFGIFGFCVTVVGAVIWGLSASKPNPDPSGGIIVTFVGIGVMVTSCCACLCACCDDPNACRC